ncbi:MAG: hypothetical protein WCT99_02545 [Bacteroidota bacterium]
MNKKSLVIIAILYLFSFPVKAQTKASVYSMFGVGQLFDNGVGINKSLGGTGIAFQSGRSMNYLNPASYLGILPNSFVIELGAFGSYNKSENARVRQTVFDGNVNYFSASLFITNEWALSAGVIPFSSVEYEISSSDQIEGELSTYKKTFTGRGGLNKMYLGNSFKVYEGLSAGFNASYIFGPLTQKEAALQSGSFSGYELVNERTAAGFYLDYGLQYSMKNNEWLYTAGLTFGSDKKLHTTNDLVLTYGENTDTLEQQQSEITIPRRIGLGLSAKQGNNFRIGVDYEWGNWSQINYSNPNLNTRNSNRFSLGLEYSPTQNRSDEDWFKTFSYRAGANYKQSYLQIDNTKINSFGINIGVGIPSEKISMVNFSLEYGKEGTLSKGLIQNSYWMLYVNVSLQSLWIMTPIE